MTDMCGFPGNRDEALIAYLYDDGDAASRGAFEAHLPTCGVCRDELDALKGVRARLGRWAPPEPKIIVGTPHSAIRNPRWWSNVPAWAQVAAALLFLGVSAGIANLDVRYDGGGLTIHTGWMSPKSQVASRKSSEVASPKSPEVTSPVANASSVTREDLVALERQLRSEFRAAQASMRTAAAADASPARTASNDADVLRRVRALLDESEKRQQRELALRVGQLLQDVNAQRQADLVRIDRSLGLVQNSLGAEVLKQRQSLNLLYRASLRQ